MSSKPRYVREQRTICGERYQELDLFWVTDREHRAGPRAKKHKASSQAQMQANAQRCKRRLVQLINRNFDERGFHCVLTYDDEHLPEDEGRAARDVTNYLRRLKDRMRREGMDEKDLKWLCVTEYQNADPLQGLKEVRFHHHLLIQSDKLDREGRKELREMLEDCWAVGRGDERETLGTVNADKLQPEQNGLQALANYLCKYPKRKKRWRASRGLRQPEYQRPNDTKWTKKRLADACTLCVDDAEWWEKKFPGWRLLGAEPYFDEERAEWRLYARFYRKPKKVELLKPLNL